MSDSTPPRPLAEAPYDLAIRSATVHTSRESYQADLYISGGRFALIAARGSGLLAGVEIDAEGLDVLPGLWHTHCHFRDPGFVHKEDFGSGTRAAALGGITFCIDQPNTQPLPVTVETFVAKRQIAESKAHVDFGLNGGGLHPDQVEGIAKEGAISMKVFNTRHPTDAYPYIPELGIVDHGHLYEIFEAAAAADVMVSIHPDDASWMTRLVRRDYIDRGRLSRADYLEAYERGYMYGHGMVVGLSAAAYYAELAGVRLYALHLGVMPPTGYDVVRHAKDHRSAALYAELELSAMLMTKERAEQHGPRSIMFATAVEAAWRAAADGTGDVLVLEHAPHTAEELEPGWKDHFSVPLGMTGVQELVPLILTQVNDGRLSLGDVVRLCSENPSRAFGLYPRKGAIQPGSDADLTIVDMRRAGVIRDEDMATKVGFSTWHGMPTSGQPVFTISRGEIVMDHGEIRTTPGHGRMIGPRS